LAVVFWKNGPKAIIFAAALEKAESMIQEGWRGRKRKRRKIILFRNKNYSIFALAFSQK